MQTTQTQEVSGISLPEHELRLLLDPGDLDRAPLRRYLKQLEKLTRGRFTLERCLERFYSGEWQAWLVERAGKAEGLGATYIWRWDNGEQCCTVPFFVGQGYLDYYGLFREIEEWCMVGGINRFRHEAPKGYARHAFEDYKVTHWVYERLMT